MHRHVDERHRRARGAREARGDGRRVDGAQVGDDPGLRGISSKPGTALTDNEGISRTPDAGSVASSWKTPSECTVQAWVSAIGSSNDGPHRAPATTDVVSRGGRSARTVTSWPASARVTAAVRPITPAPTTRTLLMRATLPGPGPAVVDEREPREERNRQDADDSGA
ncbi:hypothetical protein GCM10023403_01200 [Pseudonocardia benzenivorans]